MEQIDSFTRNLIKLGFEPFAGSPSTFIRIDKKLSTKLLVFIYKGDRQTPNGRIVFSLRLKTPVNVMIADEELDLIAFENMIYHRPDWYEVIVERLCLQMERFFKKILSEPKKQDQE